MSVDVQGVDFVTIPVDDFDVAVAFYRDVLGLEESIQYGDLPGKEFEAGNLTIAVVDFEGFGTGTQNRHGSGAVVFRVDDVPAHKAQLEAQGVQFASDIIDSGDCHQAYFLDPSGNVLGLHSRYKPREQPPQ